MKMMKLALLGGAALAVSAVAAQADDLTALKAEIEALNARVAQLETAPSVPAGYQLLSVSSADAAAIPGYSRTDKADLHSQHPVTVIGVMPTADAPATTSIEWSGYERDAIAYSHYSYSGEDAYHDNGYSKKGSDLSVLARAQIKVVGKTDTSVGEVGALVKIRGDFNGQPVASAYVKEAWGWWAMTPELTLGSGYSGSLGNVGYGYDGACSCYYTDVADVAMNPGDTSQMRLTYASGPMSMALAVEDATGTGHSFDGESDLSTDAPETRNHLGVAGQFKYTGDTFNGAIDAYWRKHDDDVSTDAYGVGAGVGFSLGDMASMSLGTQVGKYNNGQKFWVASILGSMNLSDVSHIEAAYGHRNHNYTGQKVDAVLAGVYYDPVKQLTVGLEGEWFKNSGGGGSTTGTLADLVTVFRF